MGYPLTVIEEKAGSERAYDIYSRLLKDRIVFVSGEVNEDMANSLIAQLLFLDRQGQDPIFMYINSGGGSVHAGLAIYDTMNMIKSKVHTYCTGLAASMGAFLLSSGDERYALPSSTIMIHQVSGGARGTTKDVEISYAHQKHLNDYLNKILAKNCGSTVKKIEKYTDRDNYMTAQQAVEFGLVDEIKQHVTKK